MTLLSATDLLSLFVVAGCTGATIAFVLLRRELKELHSSIDILQAKLDAREKSNDKRVDQLSANVGKLITVVEDSSRRISRTSFASSDASSSLRLSPPATPDRRSRVSVVLPTTPDLTGSGDSQGSNERGRRGSTEVFGQHLLTRHIELGNFIGEGAFGAVHKGRWRGVPVALKFLRGDDMKLIEDLCREASVLHEIDHPHIMRLYGVCTDDAELPSNWPKRYNLKPPMLVCELMTEGNFVEFLLATAPHREEKSRHWRRVAGMLEGAASGLEHLHSHGVVHRDLKALNLFVDGRGRLKIGDFGLAKMYAWSSRRRNSDVMFQRDDDEENVDEAPAIGRSPGSVAIGTWTHQAPELMCFDGKSGPVTYTPAVDIFSFAIVIIEALGANAAEELVDTTRVEIRRGKGQSPVFGIDIRGVRELLREEWHCAETTALLKIVASCGSLEPTMRPTASRLREHLSRVRYSAVHLELQLKGRSQRKLGGSPKSPFSP